MNTSRFDSWLELCDEVFERAHEHAQKMMWEQVMHLTESLFDEIMDSVVEEPV